ncbi:MAG: 30S ribosomal protein S3 [Candidatus Altiarchaeales archaeon ex4484_96]|nr:MAG: 30S ribosomal protein S3 [Candidatus Altiarchaeales archaeon ex4484_96]
MAMEKHFIQEGKIRSEMDSFLRREFSRAVYCGMDIHKTPLAVRINLYVEKPPLVIGKKGRRINKLTKVLEEKYNIENLAIDVQRVDNPVLNPEVIARRIATALERRMYRRRIVYKAMRAIMSAGARGVEISLSGKIIGKGGRSRTEKYSEGYMKKAGDSTKLVREASTQAYLKAGVIGVTVKIVPPDAVFPDQITILRDDGSDELADKDKKAPEDKKDEKPAEPSQEVKDKKTPEKPAKTKAEKPKKEKKKDGFDDLLDNKISVIKEMVESMDKPDYKTLIKSEENNQNRKTLIQWFKSKGGI